MNLIYSCVFFKEEYIKLIYLLLKSYSLFGDADENTEYLIICNHRFENKIKNIFNNLDITGKIWCLDLQTKFQAGCSRLEIFKYPNIKNYNKILYLDCDILITNKLSYILDINIEDKIYCLEEGNTNHDFWGKQFFEKNPNISGFTTGILLFKNSNKMEKLFNDIKKHIDDHVSKGLEIPKCLDQPFIVYHAITKNLYNNKKLIGLTINNPEKFNGETISHFPGTPGHHQSKLEKMNKFMNEIMFSLKTNNNKINNLYEFNCSDNFEIKVFENNIIKTDLNNKYETGSFNFIKDNLILAKINKDKYLIKFYKNFTKFISIDKSNFEIVKGTEIIKEKFNNSSDNSSDNENGICLFKVIITTIIILIFISFILAVYKKKISF